MDNIINKTMARSDLFTDEAMPIVNGINAVLKSLYSNEQSVTSWYGSLSRASVRRTWAKSVFQRITRKPSKSAVGLANRGLDYQPLIGAADDDRIPWYLYWEIVWVLSKGPKLQNQAKILDAGGTSSLFTCYLASLGHEVHSVDLNESLVSNGNQIARAMGWNMHSYAMNMKKLDFEDESFDHAYSICVFEHLDYEIKQAALSEIARVLRPGGMLSITFDYRNPAPFVVGKGVDTSEQNQLKSEKDIKRNFLSTGLFQVVGNEEYFDNGQSYLVHPDYDNEPYTFGAIFLGKV